MALGPESEFNPLAWQIITGAALFVSTVGGILWKFLQQFKAAPPPAAVDHVILERAEIADVNVLRDFVKEFRPGLERLSHIDTLVAQSVERDFRTDILLNQLVQKIDKLERDAQIAKEVRDRLAQERNNNNRNNRDRNDRDRDD